MVYGMQLTGIGVAEPAAVTLRMLRLDVLLPTRNRARLVRQAIESLLAARIPEGLSVKIVVIDNGSTDETPALLESLRTRHEGRIFVVFERRCGKSRALNAGIAATAGDLVGMIDDDEEVDGGWFAAVHRAFSSDPKLDYIGGPYVPVWAEKPPKWIPADYLAVLGEVGTGLTEQPFGTNFPGILKGGNAVIRRATLERVGPYAEYLGPAGPARLLSCEDEEMYHRLVNAGARGRYLPDLKVNHHVSASRLTPTYFRQWCFWRGVSRGLMDHARPLPVPYLAGVPRFLYGSAWRGLSKLAARVVNPSAKASLSDELKIWDLAGYFWGRHIYTLARFSPVRSRRSRTIRAEIPDAKPLGTAGHRWNSSCSSKVDHGESPSDRDQAGGVGMVEHRRTSSPVV
jgi:glycosyltransferase involved in cell wall biosynthesis